MSKCYIIETKINRSLTNLFKESKNFNAKLKYMKQLVMYVPTSIIKQQIKNKTILDYGWDINLTNIQRLTSSIIFKTFNSSMTV